MAANRERSDAGAIEAAQIAATDAIVVIPKTLTIRTGVARNTAISQTVPTTAVRRITAASEGRRQAPSVN
jgi:hypothetical protein